MPNTWRARGFSPRWCLVKNRCGSATAGRVFRYSLTARQAFQFKVMTRSRRPLPKTRTAPGSPAGLIRSGRCTSWRCSRASSERRSPVCKSSSMMALSRTADASVLWAHASCNRLYSASLSTRGYRCSAPGGISLSAGLTGMTRESARKLKKDLMAKTLRRRELPAKPRRSSPAR